MIDWLFRRVTFQVCRTGLAFDFLALATHVLRYVILAVHMTFSAEQQQGHREALITDCREKAWGAAFSADFIGASLDKVTADYQKLKDEDGKLADEIKKLELAPDSHTKDNRDKRKAMQERGGTIMKSMAYLAENMKHGQEAIQNLYLSVETNLALAKHAEKWEWKEVETNPKKLRPYAIVFPLQRRHEVKSLRRRHARTTHGETHTPIRMIRRMLDWPRYGYVRDVIPIRVRSNFLHDYRGQFCWTPLLFGIHSLLSHVGLLESIGYNMFHANCNRIRPQNPP